jgi:hypothetical protein
MLRERAKKKENTITPAASTRSLLFNLLPPSRGKGGGRIYFLMRVKT